MKNDFWKTRSIKYNSLKWVSDEQYINYIIQLANITFKDDILEVGCGTGKIINRLFELGHICVGTDISKEMLKYVNKEIQTHKSDIRDIYFEKQSFTKIISRMVFHHILKDINLAFQNCYDYLKPGGHLIIAESVPPSDDKEVVKWFSDVRKFKEDRIVFKSKDISKHMNKSGFKHIKTYEYITPKKFSSTKRWLINSGLPTKTQNKIIKMHRNAPDTVKKHYQMIITKDDVICRNKNIITIGEK